MAPRPTRRLTREQIKANRETLLALKKIEDYTAINPAYSMAALVALDEAREQAEQAQVHAKNQLRAANKQLLVTTLALHDGLQGARAQVAAQFGPDSDQVQALGRVPRRRSRREVFES